MTLDTQQLQLPLQLMNLFKNQTKKESPQQTKPKYHSC